MSAASNNLKLNLASLTLISSLFISSSIYASSSLKSSSLKPLKLNEANKFEEINQAVNYKHTYKKLNKYVGDKDSDSSDSSDSSANACPCVDLWNGEYEDTDFPPFPNPTFVSGLVLENPLNSPPTIDEAKDLKGFQCEFLQPAPPFAPTDGDIIVMTKDLGEFVISFSVGTAENNVFSVCSAANRNADATEFFDLADRVRGDFFTPDTGDFPNYNPSTTNNINDVRKSKTSFGACLKYLEKKLKVSCNGASDDDSDSDSSSDSSIDDSSS